MISTKCCQILNCPAKGFVQAAGIAEKIKKGYGNSRYAPINTIIVAFNLLSVDDTATNKYAILATVSGILILYIFIEAHRLQNINRNWSEKYNYVPDCKCRDRRITYPLMPPFASGNDRLKKQLTACTHYECQYETYKNRIRGLTKSYWKKFSLLPFLCLTIIVAFNLLSVDDTATMKRTGCKT